MQLQTLICAYMNDYKWQYTLVRVFVRLYVPIHEHMRLYVLKCACVRLLKCDPDMYAVQYFAEKLLAAVIRCYLRVPCMSKILSQDKKIFAKFFVEGKTFPRSGLRQLLLLLKT